MSLDRPWQAVVLAAGAGTRLRPLTLTRSKALAPLCGRPMIGWVVDSLLAVGIDDLIAVVADPEDDVARWLTAQSGARRLQLVQQAERRGTAHALQCAAPLLEGRFIMHACDTIVEPGTLRMLLDRHAERDALITLGLERCLTPEAIAKSGIVALDGDRVTRIVEKPKPEEAPSDLCAIPIYLFEPILLRYLSQTRPSARGELEIQDPITQVIERDGRVFAHPVPRRWQITTTDDLLELNRLWLAAGHTQQLDAAECRPPVHIGPGVGCGPGCVLGPNAVIESGARLGARVHVRHSLVLGEAVVPDDSVIDGQVIAGPLDS